MHGALNARFTNEKLSKKKNELITSNQCQQMLVIYSKPGCNSTHAVTNGCINNGIIKPHTAMDGNDPLSQIATNGFINHHANNQLATTCDITYKTFTAYYQNVRGLRTKTKDIFLNSLSCDYDFIFFSETWLHSSINDCELFDDKEYIVYRCDRSPQNSAHIRGGGVLIAVRVGIDSERLIIRDSELVEVIFVKCNIDQQTLYLCCVYIPSGSNGFAYQTFCDVMENFFSQVTLRMEDIVLVLGDFNLPLIDWQVVSGNERVYFLWEWARILAQIS